MKKIIYLHGLASSGQSATVKRLQKMMPEVTVLGPDLPVAPEEAMRLIQELCDKEKPQLVIGTSMGGGFAQQVRGYRRLLVNPSFHVSSILRSRVGVHPFFSERIDGLKEFEITPELCEKYEAMEKVQFDDATAWDVENVVALFGDSDTTVNCREEYFEHYKYGFDFHGEHRLSTENVKNLIVPLAKLLLDADNPLTEIIKEGRRL